MVEDVNELNRAELQLRSLLGEAKQTEPKTSEGKGSDIDNLITANQELISRLDNLMDALEDAAKDIKADTLVSSINTLVKAQIKILERLDSIDKHVLALSSRAPAAGVNEEIRSLLEKIDSKLSQRVSNLSTTKEMNALDVELTAVKSELASLNNAIEDLEQRISQQTDSSIKYQLISLNNRVEVLMNRLKSLPATQETYSEIGKLVYKIDTLTDKLNALEQPKKEDRPSESKYSEMEKLKQLIVSPKSPTGKETTKYSDTELISKVVKLVKNSSAEVINLKDLCKENDLDYARVKSLAKQIAKKLGKDYNMTGASVFDRLEGHSIIIKVVKQKGSQKSRKKSSKSKK